MVIASRALQLWARCEEVVFADFARGSSSGLHFEPCLLGETLGKEGGRLHDKGAFDIPHGTRCISVADKSKTRPSQATSRMRAMTKSFQPGVDRRRFRHLWKVASAINSSILGSNAVVDSGYLGQNSC